MRKIFLMILCAVLLCAGCDSTESVKETGKNNQELSKSDNEAKMKQCMTAYVECLKKYCANSEDVTEFLLKDLDADGMPELIVKQQMKVNVYAYDNGLQDTGSNDFVTGTTRLFYSEDTVYTGIFYFYVDGGLNHYGYMNIENGKLKIEELWNEDYSGISEELDEDRDKVKELSTDEKKIKESAKVYKDNCDLIFTEINADNLNEIEKEIDKYISDYYAEKTMNNNQNSTDNLIDSGKYHKVYAIEKGDLPKYRYEIYNKSGKVVKTEKTVAYPNIQKVSDNLLSISTGAGSFVGQGQYYDIEADNFSELFESLLATSGNLVVYVKTPNVLVIRDIFDKTKYFKEVTLDLAEAAVPTAVISKIEFVEDGKLKVTYLSGEEYIEKTATIEISES